MKKSLQLICLGLLILLIGTGIRLAGSFPLDTQPYVEKKYAGWNGVLQAWICTEWNPDGSFIRWLNDCASDFEKSHDGVYLEFTPVKADAMRAMHSSGLRTPDLVFFTPGVITDAAALSLLQSAEEIRSDIRNYGNGRALPIALGAYVWVYNPALCDGAPQSRNEIDPEKLSLDSESRFLYAALVGLLSDESESMPEGFEIPDPGIDLGLPASSSLQKLSFENALDEFINGNLACIPLRSKDIARLVRLRENGQGPDWQLSPAGSLACTDQVLLAGIPVQADKSTEERYALAKEFIFSLLADEAQAALTGIGAHSTTGQRIYDGFSVYAPQDSWINSRPLWLPNCFSEYSAPDGEAIVRRFLTGELSPESALSLLGFEGM